MGTFDQKKYQDFDPSDGAARYRDVTISNCIMGHGTALSRSDLRCQEGL